MKTVALVPIKMNSERVKEKNLRPFYDGKPLVQFILDALKGCKHIDEIYVYCSNDKIKDYLPEGVNFRKRPEFLDLNTSNANDIIREFIKEIDADVYVLSHGTPSGVDHLYGNDTLLFPMAPANLHLLYHVTLLVILQNIGKMGTETLEHLKSQQKHHRGKAPVIKGQCGPFPEPVSC